ncbi:MAG: PAS domain S-box protein [Deltaproteobacteria bacterium]|nr:PAS domain S-box protein [Deltaproteobacteria bacterium]
MEECLLNTIRKTKSAPVTTLLTRKSQERKTNECESRYRTLLDNVRLIAVGLDKEGKVNYVNPFFSQLTEYEADEVLGADWFEVFLPHRFRSSVRSVFSELIKTEFPPHYENPILTKFGEERLVSWNNVILKDSGGEIQGTISIGEDITERKRTEEALRVAKEKYKSITENIGLGVSLISSNMEILELNKTMRQWFPNIDTRHRPICYRSFHQPPRQEVCSFCPIIKTLQDGKSHETFTEILIGNKNVNIRLASSPVRNSEGTLVAVIKIIEDITEKKQIQERLLQSEKLAVIGEIISGVAHELNNPLTAVLGYAQMLQWEEDPGEKKRQLKLIEEQALRSAKIIQNLLTFARKQKPEKRLVDINEVLEKTLDLKAYDLSVNNIQVVKELAPTLPNILGDSHQLQQVFMNLINNAEQAMIDAHAGGTLIVRSGFLGDEDQILVEIEDDGPGIPDEIKPRIFDPFFTTKKVGKGTGLGLSLSHGIIRDHRGDISVSSDTENGKGATFTLRFPMAGDKLSCNHQKKAPEEAGIRGRKFSILIIDDESTVLDIVAKLLNREGYRVDTASSGEHGLQKMQERRFDLLICDFRMPGIDGKRLYWEIKRKNLIDEDKIIFMTGDVVREETMEFIELINGNFITKPFKLKDFKRILENVYNRGAIDESGNPHN